GSGGGRRQNADAEQNLVASTGTGEELELDVQVVLFAELRDGHVKHAAPEVGPRLVTVLLHPQATAQIVDEQLRVEGAQPPTAGLQQEAQRRRVLAFVLYELRQREQHEPPRLLRELGCQLRVQAQEERRPTRLGGGSRNVLRTPRFQ